MREVTGPAAGSGRGAPVRGRVTALPAGGRPPLAALTLLLVALAALAAVAPRADGVPTNEREERREPHFIFRFKVPTTRQTAGNVAAARPAEHEAPKLSEAEMATRQASVAEYLAEVQRSGRALDRAAFLEIYKRAGTFHVIHALLDTGVIDKTTSNRLGELRADLHQQVLDTMARSGKFGRRIGVNDFGSGAMNAKSDIDFTLYCDDASVPGTDLVEAYKKTFLSLSGNIPPGQFDLVAHRWEATIPDWRASCAEADFVQKLRMGTTLLKANPEAYFLEGAYAQQILRRSAEGTTFTWIEPGPGGKLEHRKVNAAAETPFFYRPDVRPRYAWGAAIGNWHFFNSHSHDRIAQAKYLLRSFDDGTALLARSGKKGDFVDLSQAERRALVQEVYGSGPRAERFLAILETAAEIRKSRSTGSDAYRPLVEYERREAGVALDDATALRLAQDALVRHGNAMLVENSRMAATTRLGDWLAPPIRPGKYRTFGDDGTRQDITVDAAAIKRLQLSAFFEIRDGIEKMDRRQVEAIKKDNSRMARDIDILQRLIEKQRQMALAPDGLDADAARKHRMSFAEEVIAEYRALPAVKEVGGVQALLTRAANAWDLGNTIEDRLQQRTIDAVAFNLAGRNPEVLGALEKLRSEVSRTNDQLVSPRWMQRMDRMNSLVEIAKVYLKEGEVNERVLHTVFWEGVSFLPGGGTYMTIQGGSQGIFTLASTKLIPGYGPLLVTLQLTKGVVEVGMMMIFEPLQRERLLLAYTGCLPAEGGGWVTLSGGRTNDLRSNVPSVLDGITGADGGKKDLDARREAVYEYIHGLVSKTMQRDPSFPFTEEELPAAFAEREQTWVAARIKQHVNQWWNATGRFEGYDEILAFRSRTGGESEEAFYQQLVDRLFRDYYTGKSRALQRKFLENEKEKAALAARMAEAETMDAGLDAVASGMSADFRANGNAILGYCLDEMPTVPPSMEIFAAPRVVDLELAGERENVRAVPQVGFRAKVWASEKEFPGPWTVRWELRRGGETVAFNPGQDHDLEAKVGERVGTDSSRVEVVATATDATGRQIVSASVPLEVEKVKVGEDREAERDAQAARDGTGAGTGAAAGAGVAGLVEEMEKAAGAATAAANAASAACREAAAAGRSAREKATGLTAEVEGVSGAVGALEGRAAAVSGLGTAATASLAKANALANDLAVRRDRAAVLKEKACAGADRAAAAATPAERERLLAEAVAASAELDRLAAGSESLLASIRAEAQAARRGSDELEALLAELARLDERLRAAGEAAGSLPAQVEEAKGRVEKARASLDKVVAQQAHGAQLVADGKRAGTGAGAETAAAVKKLTDLEAAIRTRKNDVAPCADAVSAADVTPAAGAVQDLVARTGELTTRLDGLRRTLGAEGLREKLRGAAAEAASLVELCEAFLESIVNRAADARACLARARSAIAAPALVVVPELRGKTRAMAEAWLGDLGLSAVVTTGGAAPTPGEAGKVASQTHPAGSRVPPGSFVGVTLWGAQGTVAAPPDARVAPPPPPPPAGLSQADCDRDWPGTVLTRDVGTGTASCRCPSGTAWSKVSRACLALPGGTVGGARTLGGCSHMPGTIRDSQTGECRCALGTWDAAQGRCVDTAAAERERDVATKRAAADCEVLFSRMKVYRGSSDTLSRNLAAEAEREARAKGCDAGRIADAKGPPAPPPVGGGTGSAPPVGGGSGTGGGGRTPATCRVTEQGGAGGVTLVYEQTALGNHFNVYVFTAPQKDAGAVQAHWSSQPGFRLVGRFGSYSQGLSAAKQACAKRTSSTGEAEPEMGLCNCVDEKGRRYTEAWGQPCGTGGEAIRDYNCPPR